MFIMALMAFAVGIVLAGLRSSAITDGNVQDAAALEHFVPAAMFVGFAAVFAAISFAIARILGQFRTGGGSIQKAAGVPVTSLNMPASGKAFIGVMMMAMMIIIGAVVLEVIAGISVLDGSTSGIASPQAAVWLEAARRFGAALYLFAITFGLATIITVLRFQSVRIREVASAASNG
jgi:hypothetical protein